MKPGFFENNRQELLKNSGCDLIVLTANSRMQRNADNTYPFRQDSSFWYLCGLDEPDFVLVVHKKSSYLIAPKRSYISIVFDGQTETDELVKKSGVDEVLDFDNGWEKLKAQLKAAQKIGIMYTFRRQTTITLNQNRQKLATKVKRIAGSDRLHDLRGDLTRLRMIKKPEEIEAIKKSIDITTDAFKAILGPKKRGRYKNEYEISAAFSHYFESKGAMHAYNPIVASGKNSYVLHYNNNNQAIKKPGSLLVDIGAETNHYAADITRSYRLGRANQRYDDVVAAVADIQAEAINQLKQGITLREYEMAVLYYSQKVLKRLGLLNRPSRRRARLYMPHATSHFLGLDVHDAGDYLMPLKAGMVLTVEPGIYIPNEEIGVRIEDDVLLTEDGNQVLSSGLPAF